MPTSVNLKPTLDFLSELEQNNTKAWLESHRARYDEARGRFEDFVQLLIGEIGKFDDLGSLSAKECIFKINRDIRFSKDKSPYKTNMGASIAPGGKKSLRQSYYVHIAPHDRSFLAGGLHMPTPEELGKFRQAIDRDAARFKRIINARDFVRYFGTMGGPKLATGPRGFAQDHPEIELLRMKEVVAAHRLSDRDVLSPDISTHAARVFKALKPFLQYLDSILL